MRTLEITHYEVIDRVPTYFGRLTADGLAYDFIAAIVSDGDGHLETLVRTASAASPSERVSISRAVLADWRAKRHAAHLESQRYLDSLGEAFDNCYSG
jgi:hypothetical protein